MSPITVSIGGTAEASMPRDFGAFDPQETFGGRIGFGFG
jgi:hypothetical protein